ncbi:MAG: enolase C-terminal domain-like protein, partial [Pseudomonadota bacterium]
HIWPHCMGTAIGQIAALSISAAVGRTSSCEIDVNENALRTNLCGDIINIRDGQVALPKAPGLVVPPDPDALTNFAEHLT